jgi:hypothetical protein
MCVPALKIALQIANSRTATRPWMRTTRWKSKYDINDMCKHQWQWASKYPQGYETPL